MVQKQVVDNEKIDAASLKNKKDILPDFREYTFSIPDSCPFTHLLRR